MTIEPNHPREVAADPASNTVGGEGADSRRVLRRGLVLLAVALVLRALALGVSADAELVKDERAYVRRAVALLEGQGYVGSYQSWVRHTTAVKIAELPQYPGAYQPPAYTTFVAAILAVSGRNPVAVKAAQVLLGALTVLLVYGLGRSWFGERAGWIAGWLAALYPNLVAFTHLLWSETLFIFLLLGLFAILTRRLEPPGRAACLGAGIVLGLAALTRSSIVYFVPVLLGWMVWAYRGSRREAVIQATIVLLVAVAVIAPWSIRNHRIHGGFVLIDTNGPYNLWRGNHPTSFMNRRVPDSPRYEWPFDDIPLHPVARQVAAMLVNHAIIRTDNMAPTDLEILDYARSSSRKYILDDPALFLSRTRFRMIDMWNPTSFMVRHLELGAYGDVSRTTRQGLTVLAVSSYLLVLAMGTVGLVLAWRDPRTWLVALFIGFITAISLVAFGLTRFRLPLMPFFILGVAYLIDRTIDRFGRWRSASAQLSA